MKLYPLITYLFLSSLSFCQTSILYIEQSIEKPNEGYIFYEHNTSIDTFKYIVSYPLVSIFDYKFNSDSSICTIIFKEKDFGYSICKFNKKENWMPKSHPSLGNGYHWKINTDTLIQSGSFPKLITFDKIQIKDGTSYTNRKTNKRIKTIEKIYFFKFDENDNLIESTNDN